MNFQIQIIYRNYRSYGHRLSYDAEKIKPSLSQLCPFLPPIRHISGKHLLKIPSMVRKPDMQELMKEDIPETIVRVIYQSAVYTNISGLYGTGAPAGLHGVYTDPACMKTCKLLKLRKHQGYPFPEYG